MFYFSRRVWFILLLWLRIFLGLSSTSLFGSWVALELNLIRFLILLFNPLSLVSSLRRIKYFLIQRLGSGIFFLCIIYINFQNLWGLNYVIFFALAWKLGMAPFQGWLISISESLSWEVFFYINTVQKVIPLFLILKRLNLIFSSIIFLRVVVAIVGGINQLILKKIIVYSSVLSLGWICARRRVYEGLLYLGGYSLSLILISYQLEHKTTRDLINQIKLSWSQEDGLILIFLLLRFSGMPPFIGFYPKILIINIFLINSQFLVLSLLLIGSRVYVIIYLRIFLVNFSLNINKLFFSLNFRRSVLIYRLPLFLGFLAFRLYMCNLNFDFKIDGVTRHT